jgi:hypothetical protein
MEGLRLEKAPANGDLHAPGEPFAVVSGADDTVCPDSLVRALVESSGSSGRAEIGVLVGREEGIPRFPSWAWIREVTSLCEESGRVSVAFHLCGPKSADFLSRGILPSLLPVVPGMRIQVNAANYPLEGVSRVVDFAESTRLRVILQWRDPEFPVNRPFGSYLVSLLHDLSGGRGVVPPKRPLLPSWGPVGYAGGVSPENVEKIVSFLGKGCYWIDAESGLRDMDDPSRFSLDRAKALVRAVADGPLVQVA